MTCVSCGAATASVRLRLERSTLAVCPRCGHGRTIAAPRVLDEGSYGLAPDARTRFERDYLDARSLSYARGLALTGPAVGRAVLDYGCGYGHFLQCAHERGWAVSGVEEAAGVRAQALAERRGDIRASLDEAAGLGPFDLITLWDVLEHLKYPATMLAYLRRVAAEPGHVLVRVPDARALEALRRTGVRRARAEIYLKLCHPTNPAEHRNHFTPRSLETIAGRAGLRLVEVIAAEADERVAAGRTAADAWLRRQLHARAWREPYEFTALLGWAGGGSG